MEWVSILAGIGIGGIVTSVVNHFLLRNSETKKIIFDKKETAYIGLLDALHQADVEKSIVNAKNYGRWHNRTMLVGSPAVVTFSQQVIDTKPGSNERINSFDNLKQAMRADLNIDKRKLNS